jgi:hypothetical protein
MKRMCLKKTCLVVLIRGVVDETWKEYNSQKGNLICNGLALA